MSALDGDQLVDFYWINALLNAERIQICRKTVPSQKESWARPGVRAFGRANGGLIFEAAYLIDRGSVPLLSYSDKSYLKGTSHWPI